MTNKYFKYYSRIISRAKNRELIDCYVERHHIIPRCMGGNDSPDNIVSLTPEEHFVCHQLLIKMYPDNPKLVYAANMMTVGNKNVHRINNKKYGWLKRKFVIINSQNCTIPMPPKEELIKLYFDDWMNTVEISKIYNVSSATVINWLKRYDIKIKSSGESLTYKIPTKEELEDLYVNKLLTSKEIGKIYNCKGALVCKWLRKYDIRVRRKNELKKIPLPTKEELFDLFVTKQMSPNKIGKLYGVSGYPVRVWLNHHNITYSNREPVIH